MAADYEFELPMPPSVNSYWATFRGRRIISKKGREYKDTVLHCLSEIGLVKEEVSEKVKVSIDLHHFQNRKYDIDNYCKCLFDALSNAKFWIDDDQVYELSIRKLEKVDGGKAVVRVYKIDTFSQ